MSPGKSFRVLTLFGLPIRIDPSWFIILALITWTLATGYFPVKFQGLAKAQYWWLGFTAALMLFISVLLHELGHALAAKACGLPAKGITLFLFGGVSELPSDPKSPGDEAKVTLGGWLVSAALAVICYGVYRFIRVDGIYSYITLALVHYLMVINALLFFFNGVPGLPLDGGRLLRAAIWKATGNVRQATRVASSVGGMFGLFLIILGVMSVFYGSLVGGIWLALIGMFLRNGAHSSYRQLLIKRALSGVHVRDLMSTDVVTIPSDVTLEDALKEYFLRRHFHSFPVVDSAGQVIGMVSIHDVKKHEQQEWDNHTVGEIAGAQKQVGGVSPDADALAAFTEMARSGQGRLPVLSDGRLEGIISRRDLLQLLAIKTDLIS